MFLEPTQTPKVALDFGQKPEKKVKNMWQKVESSNLDEVKHEGTTMSVRFKGGAEYEYQNVSQELFENVLGGSSIGRRFNELIKSNPELYPFRRVH